MLFANLLLYFHALLCIMTSQGFPYQKSWCDMSDIRAIKLSETRAIMNMTIHSDTRRVSNMTFSSETLGETWAIMSVTIHQRYTACLMTFLSETWAIMSVMIHQRYTTCLKHDIFERDMSDNECQTIHQRYSACLKRDIYDQISPVLGHTFFRP